MTNIKKGAPHMLRQAAFTLIELMIAVAVIGILAAIAYPSYQDTIRKSRRSDAQGGLVNLANFLERLSTETGCYNPGPDNVCGNGDDAAPVLIAPQNRSPATGATIYYNLSIAAAPAITTTTYTIQAIPVAGTSQAVDGSKQLTSTGVRSWDRNNDGDYLDANENSWN